MRLFIGFVNIHRTCLQDPCILLMDRILNRLGAFKQFEPNLPLSDLSPRNCA